MRADRVNLTGAGDPVRVGAVRVGLDFFTVLRVQPIIGRAFLPDDADGPRAVLIGHGLWQSRFGGDPVVAGRAISLHGEPAQVLGMLPPWFRFPAAGELPETLGFSADPEIWTLDTFSPEQQHMRGGKSLTIIGRLRDGLSAPQAESDLRPIADEIAAQFPSYNAGWTVKVIPLREHLGCSPWCRQDCPGHSGRRGLARCRVHPRHFHPHGTRLWPAHVQRTAVACGRGPPGGGLRS